MGTPVAIVQDHLVQRGGAERVALSMSRAFPDAPLYTSFWWPEACYPEFSQFDVRTMPLDRIGLLRRHHRATLPLLPLEFSRTVVEADVILCGTSGWAQGVRASGRKVVYFHAVARWIYDRNSHLADSPAPVRAAVAALRPSLLRWDRRTMSTADRFLVPGSAMARKVRDIYRVDAEILPPPVTVDTNGPQRAIDNLEPGYALCPCRLMSYKNVDAVLEAFRGLPDLRLVVAGDGPERQRLEHLAPPNVVFLGAVGDAGMHWLYAHCMTVVSAATEPFGLTPLEGAAFGKPSTVLRAGGFLDTVEEGVTGFYFDSLDPAAIRQALTTTSGASFDEQTLRAHARQWSEDAFIQRLRSIVDDERRRTD
jgi:glycosyltransferase involved in cell wall biosynthesis